MCLRSVTDLEREERLWETLPSPLLGWHHPSRGWEVGISAGQGQRDCKPGDMQMKDRKQ